MAKCKKTRKELLSSFSGKNTKSIFDIKTRDKAWWICKEGHEWFADLGNRMAGTACPYCSGRYVSEINSLANHKHLIAEFDEDKNSLSPEGIAQFSSKKVWWKCSLGHSWKAIVASRTSGQSCPFCMGKRPHQTNNLEYVFPKISKEWSSKNDLGPADYLPFSSKKVWWKCLKGHVWMARISDRTLSGSGCYECSGYSKQKKCQISEDGSMKKCNSCSLFKNKKLFRIRKSQGHWINSICKECENEKVVQYRTMTPQGIVAEILRRKKHECKVKGLPFNLTKKYLLDRLNSNGWKCELTNLPMRSVKSSLDEKYKGFHLDSISLDRIDHKGGYIKDNVRFVLNQVNIFRSSGSDERMYKIAEALLNYRKEKNE